MNYKTHVTKMTLLIAATLLLYACSNSADTSVGAAMEKYESIMQGYAAQADESQVISRMAAYDVSDTPGDFRRAWQDEKLSWIGFQLHLKEKGYNSEKTDSQLAHLTETAEHLRLVASRHDSQIKREIKIQAARERAAKKFSDTGE